jgi:hypothetical protein
MIMAHSMALPMKNFLRLSIDKVLLIFISLRGKVADGRLAAFRLYRGFYKRECKKTTYY